MRWHRDGYYPVAAQIRAVLPRYEHLADRQILREEFKLSDALELVARQSGFDSWRALKAGVQELTDTTNTTTPTAVLRATEAQLFVTDITASCEYFVSKMGFNVEFTYGDPPFYAQVKRDNAIVNLRRVDEPVFVGDIRQREQLLSASIGLDSAAELRELFVEYQNLGVGFHQTLKSEPWGARTFVARDVDGNLLLFCAPSI